MKSLKTRSHSSPARATQHPQQQSAAIFPQQCQCPKSLLPAGGGRGGQGGRVCVGVMQRLNNTHTHINAEWRPAPTRFRPVSFRPRFARSVCRSTRKKEVHGVLLGLGIPALAPGDTLGVAHCRLPPWARGDGGLHRGPADLLTARYNGSVGIFSGRPKERGRASFSSLYHRHACHRPTAPSLSLLPLAQKKKAPPPPPLKMKENKREKSG